MTKEIMVYDITEEEWYKQLIEECEAIIIEGFSLHDGR